VSGSPRDTRQSASKLDTDADVVVIGAGIMGLSVAYHLAAEHGMKRIVVLDSGYLCGGASGRNGGGVRAQWSSETNIRLMRESLDMFRQFAERHRINTWFRAGGYLFLARSDAAAAELATNVELQNRCGVHSELLGPDEIKKHRAAVVDRRRARCQLQCAGRSGFSLAVRMGIRRERTCPRRFGTAVHARDGHRNARS